MLLNRSKSVDNLELTDEEDLIKIFMVNPNVDNLRLIVDKEKAKKMQNKMELSNIKKTKFTYEHSDETLIQFFKLVKAGKSDLFFNKLIKYDHILDLAPFLANYAAFFGHKDILSRLLDFNLELGMNSHIYVLIKIAMSQGHREIIKFIREKYSISRETHISYAYDIADYFGHIDIFTKEFGETIQLIKVK